MTSPPPSPEDAKARRDRLLGRALIIGLGLMVLLYLLAALHGRP